MLAHLRRSLAALLVAAVGAIPVPVSAQATPEPAPVPAAEPPHTDNGGAIGALGAVGVGVLVGIALLAVFVAAQD